MGKKRLITCLVAAFVTLRSATQPLPPSGHGGETNQGAGGSAPLGTGIGILLGFGLGYALGKTWISKEPTGKPSDSESK